VSDPDPHGHLARLYEAAAGPLTWLDSEVARGTAGGREVTLSPVSTRSGSARDRRGAEVRFDLGGRRIAMTIDDRGPTQPARPVVQTGDEAFDDLFLVQGGPTAACRRALDPEARAWLAETVPSGWAQVTVEEGVLRGFLAAFPRGSDGAMSTAEFTRHVSRLAAMADGLEAGYDRKRDAIVSASGEEAGREWEASLGRRESQDRRSRTAVLALVMVGFGIIVLGIVGGVLAAAGLL